VALTKADIVESIHTKLGFSKKEAADLVEMIFDQIKGTLSKSSKIKISGFGNFVVREKRSRTGRNPQTGESIKITARKVLTFRPSQVLRAEVNSSLEGKEISAEEVQGANRRKSDDDDED
jgi:integration host factor subunit alpha